MKGDAAPRIVSFVAASSGSGKTTLIEKVVGILKGRGLRVAVIKHASKGFELDREGKDSWRFQQAGAETVILAGPDRLALMKRTTAEPGLDELVRLAGDVDIVIVEGFKRSTVNRIEVFRHGVSGDRPMCMADPAFLALASDMRFDVAIPQLDINNAGSVADFVADVVKRERLTRC